MTRRVTRLAVFLGLAGLLALGVGEDLPPTRAAAPPPDARKVWTQATFGGGVDRNMVNLVERKIASDWNVTEGNQKNIKWAAAIDSRPCGGLVVYGGRVFFATVSGKPRNPNFKGPMAVLTCFAEKDGTFLWENVHRPPDPQVCPVFYDGLGSTPTVEGDFVYYCTPNVEVICAQVKDGKIVWRRDLMEELRVFPRYLCNCSPLVVGDQVYVLTGNGTDENGVLQSPRAPSFVALNKANGKVVWDKDYPGAAIIEGQWGSPAWAEPKGKPQVIFGGGDGYLYGLEPTTGDILWKFKCSPKQGADDRGVAPYFVATPVVYDNKVYVGVGAGPNERARPKIGHFYCIDITRKGDVSCKNENYDPKDPANKDCALVWHRGGLIKPPPKDGRRVYFHRTMSTVAVHAGLVYAAEEQGYLQCLDARSGKQYWDHDLLDGVWTSPYWVDGRIYLGTQGGDCHVFQHGKEYQKLRVIDMDAEVVATPVAANGVLFVATRNKIYAIAAAK
jgi:outer membrane protein assembly factor BamB